MCCIDPRKYFGGYYDAVEKSLEEGAEFPYLDGGLPREIGEMKAKSQSSKLLDLQLATESVQ